VKGIKEKQKQSLSREMSAQSRKWETQDNVNGKKDLNFYFRFASIPRPVS
jgi:hypothetical protein